ncbi:MAG: TnsD family Tn7-like transposition protein [Chloroflexota bacterium]
MNNIPDSRFGYFPPSYEFELFYNTEARYVHRANFWSMHKASRNMFGVPQLLRVLSLPKLLKVFESKLPSGHRLNSEKVINQHTMYSYFKYFLTDSHREELLDRMLTGTKIRYQIFDRIINSVAYLRLCRECVADQRREYGEAYWDVRHQIPYVKMCFKHKIPLTQSLVETRTVCRLKEHMITAERAINDELVGETFDLHSEEDKSFHIWLAQTSSSLFNVELPPCNLKQLKELYLLVFKSRGFDTIGNLSLREKFYQKFTLHYKGVPLDELDAVLDVEEGINWLGRFIYDLDNEEYTSPIYHLLILNFLGIDIEEFFKTAVELDKSPFFEGPWHCFNPQCPRFLKRSIHNIWVKKGKYHVFGNFQCSCGFAYTRRGPYCKLGNDLLLGSETSENVYVSDLPFFLRSIPRRLTHYSELDEPQHESAVIHYKLGKRTKGLALRGSIPSLI